MYFLQIFHRRVVPIVLPYHSSLDTLSWWMSQAITQLYLHACTPRASVMSSFNVDEVTPSHSMYPSGWLPFETLHGVLRLEAPEIGDFVAKRGSVKDPGAVPWRDNVQVDDVPRWWTSSAFSKCLSARLPNFILRVGGGIDEAEESPTLPVASATS